jgi:putative transposase
MGTVSFERNARIRIEETVYTLRRMLTDTCWQLENPRNGRTLDREQDDLLRSYMDGSIEFVVDKDDRPHSTVHVEPTPQEKEIISIRLQYVRAVRELPVTQAAYEQAIAEVWQNLHRERPNTKTALSGRAPGWITVYRWQSRHREFGDDSYALLYRKRNRAINYPSEVLEICDESLETVYFTRERNTLQDALDFASQRVIETNEIRKEQNLAPFKAPSRRLFKTLLRDIPSFDQYAARYGRQAALAKFRSVRGHRVTKEPLERGEIDHTPLDLFVIDDNPEHSLPLGRPYVTLCIDDFTRCVLGVYIGFVPPSHLSVAQCLKHAFLPKIYLKGEHPHTAHLWVQYGVMRELVVDQALEFHGHSLTEGCRRLGIEIHFSPRKQAWFKGKIERIFRSLNEGVAHGVRGTTFSNTMQKGDYDPQKAAVVRLSTLKAAIHKWICDVYHQKKHRALGMPPAEMWATHFKPQNVRLPEDREALDATMGRLYDRVLTHKGVEFQGLVYNSEAFSEIRNRFGSRLEVQVLVDESDIGSVYVRYKDVLMRAPALNYDYANGISAWQHKLFQQNAPNSDPKSWLLAKEQIRQMYEDDFDLTRRRRRKGVGRHLESKALNLPSPHKLLSLPGSTETDVTDLPDDVADTANDIPKYKALIKPRGPR